MSCSRSLQGLVSCTQIEPHRSCTIGCNNTLTFDSHPPSRFSRSLPPGSQQVTLHVVSSMQVSAPSMRVLAVAFAAIEATTTSATFDAQHLQPCMNAASSGSTMSSNIFSTLRCSFADCLFPGCRDDRRMARHSSMIATLGCLALPGAIGCFSASSSFFSAGGTATTAVTGKWSLGLCRSGNHSSAPRDLASERRTAPSLRLASAQMWSKTAVKPSTLYVTPP
mmetsp:Transcript_13552/g.30876  ORF Transcript_13552/g.30876 Transcript_13552/m.30876 type:complete len:223 (-) Transcript_13552:586-1254(-)